MNRVFCKRCYSKKVEDAFTRRLEQLETEYVKKDDPLLGAQFQSLIDKNERLSKIHGELEQREFELKHQRMIHASKIPGHADKHSRDIALSQPWTGEERLHDTNLRMLVDKHKPLRSQSEAMRLGRVREAVLDFKINKNPDTSDEDSTFRTIYQERFTPIGSFNKIKTIADARIDEAIRQGQFRNIPRGKKLEVDVKPYVDRTEHHLNNILVKQNIVPPWIEQQGGVNGKITSFRADLVSKWKSHIRNFYKEDHDLMWNDFKKRWKLIFETKISNVNSSIRTYNLQAPMSTQKFYLLLDKEFQRCVETVDVPRVVEEHKRQIQLDQGKKEVPKSFSFKFWKWVKSD
jgi:hypothetical protein